MTPNSKHWHGWWRGLALSAGALTLLVGCATAPAAPTPPLPSAATPVAVQPSPPVPTMPSSFPATAPPPLASTATSLPVMPTGTPTPAPVPIPNPFGLTLPPGVAVALYADNLNYPTALAFDEAGALYVGINNAIYPTQLVGEILRMVDSDRDGVADAVTRFATGLDRPVGLLFHQGELYVSQRGSVRALRDGDGDGVAEQSRALVEGLPADGLHHNNSLAWGPDGALYFTLGSSTNNGPEGNPLNATLLRVSPEGGEVEIVASGLRNAFDLAFDEQGNLFATDNGCDPPVCPDAPEELNHIVAGAAYGFPEVVGVPPEGSTARGPLATFAPHSSANGLIVYGGAMFPEWQGDAFVALFGSYLSGFEGVGHRVLRVELVPENETFRGEVQPWGEGFARPLDLAVAPDGSLLVADFEAGRIYRLYRP